MAKTMWSHVEDVGVVGDYVYRPFGIMKPGKIIEIVIASTEGIAGDETNGWAHKINPGDRVFIVKWLHDGSVTQELGLFLHDFKYATEEHLKKYNKFKTLCDKLDQLT